MKRPWTEQEIWDWYHSYPWLRGCNFLPSNVINRIDMWQSYKFDEHIKVAEKELELAEKTGFNMVRYWVNFDVYCQENEFFYVSLEKYIELAAKYHQYVILVLTYEEDLPWDENHCPNKVGPQKLYKNHFNRDYDTYQPLRDNLKFKHYSLFKEYREKFYKMIEEVVTKYKNDKRILFWNVVNEPGAAMKDGCIPYVKELTNFVRSLDPSQPLASDCCYPLDDNGNFANNFDKCAYECSDLISYHDYASFPEFKNNIEHYKKFFNKPIIVTEWLHRIYNNNIEDIFPYLYENNIGSCIWGFVDGLTYTKMPWPYIYIQVKDPKFAHLDINKWQHELYKKDYTPYSEKEMNVIKSVINKIN